MTQPEEASEQTRRAFLKGIGLATPILAFFIMEIALTIQASARAVSVAETQESAIITIAFSALIAFPGALVTCIAVIFVAVASLRNAPLALISPLLALALALVGVGVTDVLLDLGLHHVLEAYREHAFFITRDLWSADLGWWWLIAWIIVLPLSILTIILDVVLLPFLPFIIEEVGMPAMLATLNGLSILLAASLSAISTNAAYAWSKGTQQTGLDIVAPIVLTVLLAGSITSGVLLKTGFIQLSYPEEAQKTRPVELPTPPPPTAPDPTPEPQPEPPATPQPAEIAQARASSSFKGGKHPPEHAFDGTNDTSWQEGVPGHGAGQWIEATLEGRWRLDRIEMSTGFDAISKDKRDLFQLNAHAREVRLEIDGKAIETKKVARDQRSLSFEGLDLDAQRARLVITRVYPGRRWKDLCVSEIKIIGVPVAEGTP